MINFLDEPSIDFPKTVNGGLTNNAMTAIIVSIIIVIAIATIIVMLIKNKKNRR